MLSSQKCTSLTLVAEIMGRNNEVWIQEGCLTEAQSWPFWIRTFFRASLPIVTYPGPMLQTWRIIIEISNVKMLNPVDNHWEKGNSAVKLTTLGEKKVKSS